MIPHNPTTNLSSTEDAELAHIRHKRDYEMAALRCAGSGLIPFGLMPPPPATPEFDKQWKEWQQHTQTQLNVVGVIYLVFSVGLLAVMAWFTWFR